MGVCQYPTPSPSGYATGFYFCSLEFVVIIIWIPMLFFFHDISCDAKFVIPPTFRRRCQYSR